MFLSDLQNGSVLLFLCELRSISKLKAQNFVEIELIFISNHYPT